MNMHTGTIGQYYLNERPEVISLIPRVAQKILDVGCSAGKLGARLKSERPFVEIAGIELNPEAAKIATDHLDKVVVSDIEQTGSLPFDKSYFDSIIFADVLEHLRNPEAVLRNMRSLLKDDGCIICSVPNVRHQSVLLDLLVKGQWEYTDEGIMDRTHLRFFTLNSIIKLLADTDFVIETVKTVWTREVTQLAKLVETVRGMGGNADRFEQEAKIVQYIFRARPIGPVPAGKGAEIYLSSVAPDSRQKVEASIIIPVFNQNNYTRKCLSALAKVTAGQTSFEVIVINNGSTDDTSSFLGDLQTNVRVVSNSQNFGFARACNQGASIARGDCLVFLNNDTIPQRGWLESLVKITKQSKDIGVVGSKLLYPGSGSIQHAGIQMINGVPDHIHRYAPADKPEANLRRNIDMVTGACMLVRKDLFEQASGFDEKYQNGVEDIDLCLKVKMLGKRVVYEPKSVLFHYEGVTEGRFDNVNDNLKLFFEKWGDCFDEDGHFQPDRGSACKADKESVKRVSMRWEGSQFIWHSLALVNREICLELISRKNVELSIVPYEPDQFSEKEDNRFSALAKRFNRSLKDKCQIHVRHQWPPNFDVPKEGWLVLMQPWEFGAMPEAWVKPVQCRVDEVWVPSGYVKKVYVDAGIPSDKVVVIPNGINPDKFNSDASPVSLKTEKGFRFLFVGGTIFRKGIDIVLDVFLKTFTVNDDVCLVIKDIGSKSFYRGGTLEAGIRDSLGNPENPEIVYMDRDIPEREMPGLYTACDCLVHPYRGEGFGLPVLEAMACGLPVIVSKGGATDDFVDDKTGFRIPSKKINIGKSIDKIELVKEGWLLEVDRELFGERMRWVYEHPGDAGDIGKKAEFKARTDFTWGKTTDLIMKRLSFLVQRGHKKKILTKKWSK